jgi:DNA polymerase III delta prime subunit
MTQDEIDYTKLAAQIDPSRIVEEMDTGKVAEDRFMLTKRQLAAIAGSGLGAGALGALGIGEADAQTASGQIGTASNPVSIEAADFSASGNASVTGNSFVVSEPTQRTDSAGNFIPLLGSTIEDNLTEVNSSSNEFIPQTSGFYEITTRVTVTGAGTSDEVNTRILENGSRIEKTEYLNEDCTLFRVFTNHTVLELNAGDSYQFQVTDVTNSFNAQSIRTVIKKSVGQT